MTTVWAREALTASGWARDVRIDIAADGAITAITPGAPRAGTAVDTLLPAPVNLHSHAFQRAMAGMTERRGPDPRDTFWTWRQLMYRFLDRLTPDDVEAIAALVQTEMLEAGFAGVAEFQYLHHQPGGAPYQSIAEMAERIVAAAATTGIGLTLLPVLYRYGGCDRRPLGPGQIRFGSTPESFADLAAASRRALEALPGDARFGIAPHSLRAVGPDDLEFSRRLADGGPVHMHLAEQPAEVDEVQAAWGAPPVELLFRHTTVDARWCFIHCTQLGRTDVARLAATGATVGLCPITESSLGDGIYEAVTLKDSGGSFGIGSDSNIRISLCEELRTLEYSQRLRDRSRAVLATPDRSTGRLLLESAAVGGAIAAARPAGRIAAGALADFLALDGTHLDLEGKSGDEAIDAFVFAGDSRMVRHVWAAGRHVVVDGRHHRRDQIRERYRAVIARLGDTL